MDVDTGCVATSSDRTRVSGEVLGSGSVRCVLSGHSPHRRIPGQSLDSSSTTSSAPSTRSPRPPVSTHDGFSARLLALRSSGPVANQSVSECQTVISGLTCGRRSGRTVACQQVSAARQQPGHGRFVEWMTCDVVHGGHVEPDFSDRFVALRAQRWEEGLLVRAAERPPRSRLCY